LVWTRSGSKYFVPEWKVLDLLELVRDVVAWCAGGKGASVLALQSLVGKVQSTSSAVPLVTIFLQLSYAALSNVVRSDCSFVQLDAETMLDLKALYELQSWSRLSSWPAEKHVRLDLGKVVRLETDASIVGWGVVMYTGTEFKMWESMFGVEFYTVPIHIKEMWDA
jgi:hypothetical protein